MDKHYFSDHGVTFSYKSFPELLGMKKEELEIVAEPKGALIPST